MGAGLRQAKLEINGMSCDSCVSQIRERLVSLSGVQHARVALGNAEIWFDDQHCTVADFVSAIHELGGFQVTSFATETRQD